jgi:hypothetical protein
MEMQGREVIITKILFCFFLYFFLDDEKEKGKKT